MPQTDIEHFEIGRPVAGVYALTKKQRLMNRNGDPYLALQLSDHTGTIEARVWNNAEHFDHEIQVGDAVSVVGKPTKFRDTTQFDVRRIFRADATGTSFVPVTRRQLSDLAGEVTFLIDEIGNAALASLVRRIWLDEHSELLFSSPATAHDHHAWVGGLAEHTVAVTALCSSAADQYPALDRDLLLAAALLHDIGRAKEITVEGTIQADPLGSSEGHILLAHEMLLEQRAASGITPEQWANLLHVIAQHHSQAERCRSKEALALLTANQLDIRMSAPKSRFVRS